MGFVKNWLTFDKVIATIIVALFMAHRVDVTQLVGAVVMTPWLSCRNLTFQDPM